MSPRIVFAAVLAAAALSGCGSSPKVAFYTLSPSVPAEAVTATGEWYSVGVGPVGVPDTVDRPQLVLTTGANQVTIAETARWAEPIRSGISRVIANNLGRLLDGARVTGYPQSSLGESDYQVRIDVQRFESAPGESATVEVMWAVRAANGGGVVNGRSRVSEHTSGPGFAALLAAHDRALATVSRDIANGIRRVATSPSPPPATGAAH